ncbi:hypothetical protein AAEX37_00097 [Oligella sp. MSHR50489EDL]|uniref:FHA domain-containing protein n=1 Tax=Oligella sp. MSHR50489EDL TaxID=3139409 RepID=UPI003D8146FD
MKIKVQNQSKSFERSFDLVSPGLTIGRSPENHIALADPSISISLFQAAITIDEAAQISIRNLALTPILVGNQSLKVGEIIPLRSDSEFSCGDFIFKIENADIKSPVQQATKRHHKTPTVMPMPGSEHLNSELTPEDTDFESKQAAAAIKAENTPLPLPPSKILDLESFASTARPTAQPDSESPEIATEPTQAPNTATPISAEKNTAFSASLDNNANTVSDVDMTLPKAAELNPTIKVPSAESADSAASIFDSLFSGNGVVPVGAEVNYDLHPFDMTSATVRNSDNPLAELQCIALDANLSKDPLERLSRDGIEHQQVDIFQDSRPSTLLHSNEQGLQQKNHALDHLDNILLELEQLGRLGK